MENRRDPRLLAQRAGGSAVEGEHPLRRGAIPEGEAIFPDIGRHGAELIDEDSGILTHCNTGSLTTAGLGTAFAVLFTAARRGNSFRVYADETQPLLQGARLTAWELQKAGIDPRSLQGREPSLGRPRLAAHARRPRARHARAE